MTDQKIKEFAEILVERSAKVEEGDNVYLLAKSLESMPLFEEVRKQIIKKGGRPHEHLLYDSQLSSEGMDYDWIKHAPKSQLKKMSEAKMKEMKEMDAYIRIGGGDNTQELSGLNPEKISAHKQATEDILTERLKKKWVATRYPTDSLAQAAGMPTEEFRDFLLEAVTEVDWRQLEEKNEKIKEKFDDSKKVRIKDDNTDLTLSLEKREGVCDNGDNNIPCGEVFYAPRKESLEGKIKFTYPGVQNGTEVEGIELKFENGRIVDYSAESNEEFLEKMIESDEGSHYIGELGIGTNQHIDRYVKSTLFDEKIGGTIHLAIGRAYEECVENEKERNQSSIHWDIVKDLRKEKGGGKIIVDGETVQKNGEWQI
ncbi:MAG: aminopeptidase [Candidatus Nanohaloarchaea archaeon]